MRMRTPLAISKEIIVVVVHVDNFTMDSAGRNHIVAFSKAFAEFTYFFLAFLLRTNHEEIKYHKEDNDKSPAGKEVALLCGLKKDVVRSHVWYWLIAL